MQDRPLHVDPEIDRASTIASSFYKDRSWFDRSREEVFARSWQFIGDTDGVRQPGAVQPFTLLEGFLDEPMMVTRDMDDQIHLLSNVCTHRGMAIAEGCSNERYLRCRYHGRRFGLDGTFQHMPEFEEAKGFPSASDNLARPHMGQWVKLLFGSIDPVVDFESFLKPVLTRLGWLPIHEFLPDPSRARDYMVRANWALYVDNYLEGFHIPFIHAGLNDVLDYENYECEQFPWANLQLAVGKGSDDVFELPRSSPDFGQNISAYYFWMFPNTMLNFYPWGLSVNVVRPIQPDLTRVSFLPYVWRPELLGQGAGGDLDRVEREDEVVVELVQKGVRSRFYDRGRYSPRREANVHHFHRILSRQLAN